MHDPIPAGSEALVPVVRFADQVHILPSVCQHTLQGCLHWVLRLKRSCELCCQGLVQCTSGLLMLACANRCTLQTSAMATATANGRKHEVSLHGRTHGKS